jgi:hypothetical protein
MKDILATGVAALVEQLVAVESVPIGLGVDAGARQANGMGPSNRSTYLLAVDFKIE